MKKFKTKKWLRISKSKARKLYFSGEDVYCLPNKMNPENPWEYPCLIEEPQGCICYVDTTSFDWVVDRYTYRNCNTKTGTYCSYYIKIAKG